MYKLLNGVAFYTAKEIEEQFNNESVVTERERATAAEAQLQTNIETEQSRAEGAEQVLDQKITSAKQSVTDLSANVTKLTTKVDTNSNHQFMTFETASELPNINFNEDTQLKIHNGQLAYIKDIDAVYMATTTDTEGEPVTWTKNNSLLGGKVIETFGDGLKYNEETKKLDTSKYIQTYNYDDLGVYITGAHNYGSIVSIGGRFTSDIKIDSITYFIDVLFEAKNNNLYARVLSNNSPLSICQVTDENGLNQFYLMNKNGSGIYTINVLQYSDFILNNSIKLSANVSSELFKPFTVINPIDEPPTESGSYSLNVEVAQSENYVYQRLNQYSPNTIEVGTDVIRVEITDSGGVTKLILLPGETKEYSGATYSFIDGVVTASSSWYNQGMKTYKIISKELTYKWSKLTV